MSSAANALARFQKPFMVYGYYDSASSEWHKYTRMSSTVTIMSRHRLKVANHVWVWHYTILDATEGISIDEGVQIGAYVGIFTHGSQASVRLLGRNFVHVPNVERLGYTRGSVRIGAYSFIGASSLILPGVTIGKGCIIGAGSLVSKDVSDYSIVVGSPAKVVGSTIDIDARYFRDKDFSTTYYDAEALRQIRDKLASDEKNSRGVK
jgi:acetyltransferase-like isoleucine patch superfamily enzyme